MHNWVDSLYPAISEIYPRKEKGAIFSTQFEHSGSPTFQMLSFCFLVHKHNLQEAKYHNYAELHANTSWIYPSLTAAVQFDIHEQLLRINSRLEICKFFIHLSSVILTSMSVSFSTTSKLILKKYFLW